MKFKEQLKLANDNNIDITALVIANECECCFEFDYTDEEFEELCGVAERAYLKAEEMTAYAVARCINDMIVDDGYSVQQVVDMETWDIITEASYYL